MTPVAAARSPDVVPLAEPVGDLIAHALAEIGVTTVFGVSLDPQRADHRRRAAGPHPLRTGAQRSGGATSMADAYASVESARSASSPS